MSSKIVILIQSLLMYVTYVSSYITQLVDTHRNIKIC